MKKRPGHDEPEEIPAEHLAAVLDGLAQAERGQFATDAEVEAAFRRFEQASSHKRGEQS